VRQFLNLAAAALVDNCVLDQSSLDVYRSNVGTARNNVLGVIDKVEALNQKIASSKVAAENSKEVAAQEAVVQSAQAKVNNYEVQLGKTTLVSPLDGIVTEVKIGIGEIALPNTPVISVISRSKFEIEAKVAEADVAKLKVGNLARVTLDAYGEEVVLEARLVSISPAATLIEGVPTYKSIFQFTSEDSRLKAGFTANIDIETSKRLNVVVIPERAVISKDGEKVARVLDEKGTVREVNVKTGLRGSDGNLEVIEGIREGEKVIVALKKK
jgi:RND family efflux transporter MFP subunit